MRSKLLFCINAMDLWYYAIYKLYIFVVVNVALYVLVVVGGGEYGH